MSFDHTLQHAGLFPLLVARQRQPAAGKRTSVQPGQLHAVHSNAAEGARAVGKAWSPAADRHRSRPPASPVCAPGKVAGLVAHMIPQIACRGKRMDQVWTSIRTANSGAQEGPAGVAGRSSGSSELGRLTVGDFFLSVGMEDLPPNNPFSQVRSDVRIVRAVRPASSGVELDV